jgi:hypothetical protein
MNYDNIKSLFNYILKHKYQIKKDNQYNDIMYIDYETGVIKCKYLLLFTLDKENKIFWSCNNPFIDQKTRKISLLIKNYLLKQTNIPNNVFTDKINKFLYILLKKKDELNNINFENEKIDLLWMITGKIKEGKQIYIITEIIYM